GARRGVGAGGGPGVNGGRLGIAQEVGEAADAGGDPPNPRALAMGPVWPNAEILTMTSEGRARESSLQPRFQRSSVPGRKFSVTTSGGVAESATPAILPRPG